jgi:hypothetical protein
VFNDYTYSAFTAVVTFAPAVMTSPANASTLTGSSTTFNWTTGTGVSQYWIYVSNTGAGGNELANLDKGAATSHAMTGLPTNGSTVYVRLWSKNAANGAWVFNDYTYTAFTAAITFLPAAMSSPVNGSTLPGSSTTFQWTLGIGVSQYWIYVSNTGAGGNELANLDKGAGTSHAMTGLPVNGSALYVRLWSKNAATGAWVYNDYTYVAAGTTFIAAAMTSPANGAVIGSSTAAFQWSAGTGVSGYWLYVSTTTAGGSEMYNADQGTATSHTISGLPNNGTPIYVRLWSKNVASGVWVYIDYAYH